MRGQTERDSWDKRVQEELTRLGFSALPAREGSLRAVKGHCEVHIRLDGDRVSLGIPVVRLPEPARMEALTLYLDGRNASGKGPGTFEIIDGAVWYNASCDEGEPGRVAATALSMQKTVEKIGPKVLNIMR